MKRLIVVLLFAVALARPAGAYSFQSPIETPAALASPIAAPTPTAPAAIGDSAPGVSPLVWIVAGFLLGGVMIFILQRASPHER